MSTYASDSSDDDSVAPPIRVAARRQGNRRAAITKRLRKQYGSPLFDDREFPHPQDDWESMLPDVKDGRLIRWLLVVFCWLALVVGFWLLVVGCWLLMIGC